MITGSLKNKINAIWQDFYIYPSARLTIFKGFLECIYHYFIVKILGVYINYNIKK